MVPVVSFEKDGQVVLNSLHWTKTLVELPLEWTASGSTLDFAMYGSIAGYHDDREAYLQYEVRDDEGRASLTTNLWRTRIRIDRYRLHLCTTKVCSHPNLSQRYHCLTLKLVEISKTCYPSP